MVELSEGICAKLNEVTSGDDPILSGGHLVQVLSIKVIQSNKPGAANRYRLVISDGIHSTWVMIATQLNDLVVQEQIVKHSIIALDKIAINLLQIRRIYVIMSLRVIPYSGGKIGHPTNLPGSTVAPEDAGHAGANESTEQKQPTHQHSNQQNQSSSKSGQPVSVYPIEGLSPYQNNWTIKARVTQKSDIRTYSNQRGEGKFFHVNLMDDSGEIRGTVWNTQVDELYDKFQEGKVYYISKGRVNLAKKQFSNLPNDYELGFERNTEVIECLETSNVPMMKYNFVQLGSLQDLAKDASCDVLAVVKEVGQLGEVTSRQTNKQVTKRELTLVDRSGFSVRLTLWGKQAEQFNVEDASIIAFKGVKVNDFNGRSLSMTSSSTMSINPDIEEAFVLRGWYDSTGADQSFQAHARGPTLGGLSSFNRQEIMTIEDVKAAKLGENPDHADIFSTRATIMHIKNDNLFYLACPGRGGQTCRKKMTQNGDQYICEKCDLTLDKPNYMYSVSLAVADHSGQAWVSGFGETGELLFGKSANELHDILDRDENEFNACVAKANCNTYNFTCKADTRTFNDSSRVRYTVRTIQPLDYREEGRFLVDLLRSNWAH